MAAIVDAIVKADAVTEDKKDANIKPDAVTEDKKDVKEDNEFIEPLLDPRNYREMWIPFDPRYAHIIEHFYKRHEGSNWSYTDIVYSQDLSDWSKMKPSLRHLIKMVLAFFFLSDVLVNKKEKKDTECIQIPELKIFIDNKIDRENVHTLTYMSHIYTLITDIRERETLFSGIKDIPVIQAKANWLTRYTQDGTFVERMVATIITEGVFFLSSFTSIYYLKSRNLMPALCHSNEFIARDEGLHRDCAIYVYMNYIVKKLPLEKFMEMFLSGVELEVRFVREALPMEEASRDMVGIDSKSMCDYVRMCADDILNKIHGKKYFCIIDMPLAWMKIITTDVKTNFFDKHTSHYAKSSMGEGVTESDNSMIETLDF